MDSPSIGASPVYKEDSAPFGEIFNFCSAESLQEILPERKTLLDLRYSAGPYLERLLRNIVVLTVHHLLEAADRIGDLHGLVFAAGEDEVSFDGWLEARNGGAVVGVY